MAICKNGRESGSGSFQNSIAKYRWVLSQVTATVARSFTAPSVRSSHQAISVLLPRLTQVSPKQSESISQARSVETEQCPQLNSTAVFSMRPSRLDNVPTHQSSRRESAIGLCAGDRGPASQAARISGTIKRRLER